MDSTGSYNNRPAFVADIQGIKIEAHTRAKEREKQIATTVEVESNDDYKQVKYVFPSPVTPKNSTRDVCKDL
jgi:hypothetical protein